MHRQKENLQPPYSRKTQGEKWIHTPKLLRRKEPKQLKRSFIRIRFHTGLKPATISIPHYCFREHNEHILNA